MSKKKSLCVLFALCSLLFIGCDEESYIVDWSPVEIIIYAEDSDGNSIIQQEMPGMTLTFQGETYTVRDWKSVIEEKKTRAYLAQIYGFIAETYSEDSTAYRLYFGEIDGAADMDEDIVLTWPDGSTDTIHYHCSDHKEGKNPKCNRSWKLNGQKHSGREFHFTGK